MKYFFHTLQKLFQRRCTELWVSTNLEHTTGGTNSQQANNFNVFRYLIHVPIYLHFSLKNFTGALSVQHRYVSAAVVNDQHFWKKDQRLWKEEIKALWKPGTHSWWSLVSLVGWNMILREKKGIHHNIYRITTFRDDTSCFNMPQEHNCSGLFPFLNVAKWIS